MGYQKATTWKGEALKGAWVVSRKLDGVRALRSPDGSAVSRNGEAWAGIDNLPSADCEVFLGSWGATIGAFQRGETVPEDAVFSLGEDLDPRLVLDDNLVDPSVEKIRELAEGAIAAGDEGVVLYSKDTGKWIRVKKHDTVDLPVLDVQVKGFVVTALVTAQGKVPVTGSRIRADVSDRHWLDESVIGSVIEVKYQEMTRAGKMRSPKLVRFRPDKAA